MALLELLDVAPLAARALGRGPHALAAAIELAGQHLHRVLAEPAAQEQLAQLLAQLLSGATGGS